MVQSLTASKQAIHYSGTMPTQDEISRSAGTSRTGNRNEADAANCAALTSTEEPGATVAVSARAETLDPQSDAALVARAAQGDVTAFGVLVERYQRPMAALVGRIATNPDDVDDIVQELFVRA